MTAKLKIATDTTMAEAFGRAGVNRHRLEMDRLIRKAVAAWPSEADRVAAADRVLRRAGDAVMIEVIGKAVWDAAVAAHVARLTETQAPPPAPRDRDDEGHGYTAASDGHNRGAPSSRPHDGDEGHKLRGANDSHVLAAPSPSPHRDDEGQHRHAAFDGQNAFAPSSRSTPAPARPLKTQAGLAAFQPRLANSLLVTFRVDGKSIGHYSVREARAVSTERLAALGRQALPYRVLKAAAQHAANAPDDMQISVLCSDSDIQRYISEATSHAV